MKLFEIEMRQETSKFELTNKRCSVFNYSRIISYDMYYDDTIEWFLPMTNDSEIDEDI